MNTMDLVDADWLQPFTRCLEIRCIDATRYLEEQYIDPELVVGGGRILKRQAWRFFEAVEQHEGLDTLGFLDNDPVDIDNLGGLGPMLAQAVTLKDALDTFCQLIEMSAEGNSCWLQLGPVESWILCHTERLSRSARVADHYTIVVLRQVIRLAAGPKWQPVNIRLYSEPSSAIGKIHGFEKASFCFEEEVAGIAFPTALLRQPILPEYKAGIDDSVSPDKTSSKPLDAPLAQALTCLLSRREVPTAEELAEIAGISRSTFYRLLADEGISFRRLLERSRFDRARKMLADPSVSIKLVAFDLGYQNASNFVRAFRRMAGCTPSEYRNQLLLD